MPGDASSFFNFLNDFFSNLKEFSYCESTINDTFRINYTESTTTDEFTIEVQNKSSLYFTFKVSEVIPVIEKLENGDGEYFLTKVAGKLISFFKSVAQCLPENRLTAIIKACEDDEIETNINFYLPDKLPKMLVFYFEYNKYFNLLEDNTFDEDSFRSRIYFSRILQETFKANTIFSDLRTTITSLGETTSSVYNDNIDEEYELNSFVGYYGGHYMAFASHTKSSDEKPCWFLCEDSKYKSIGEFDDLLFYLEKSKIIPFIVFYKRKHKSKVKKVDETDEYIHKSQSVKLTESTLSLES